MTSEWMANALMGEWANQSLPRSKERESMPEKEATFLAFEDRADLICAAATRGESIRDLIIDHLSAVWVGEHNRVVALMQEDDE